METRSFDDNCFTLLRNLFALGIFLNHAFVLTDSKYSILNSGVYVCGFFIISGFLTFHSFMQNSDLRAFLRKRFRRIYPPYAITILFCLLLGALQTDLTISDFFSRSETLRYVCFNLLFLNGLQPTLPGVFEGNALPVMNGALWTMKIEVLFYCSVPVVFWLIQRFEHRVVLSVLLVFSLTYTACLYGLFHSTGNTFYDTLAHQFPGEIVCFYLPVLLLYHKEWVCHHWLPLFLFSLPLCTLCLWQGSLLFAFPLFLTPVILIVAYSFRCRFRDLSYEFYLLHFPILQTFIHSGITTSIPLLLLLAFMTTCLMAGILHVGVKSEKLKGMRNALDLRQLNRKW